MKGHFKISPVSNFVLQWGVEMEGICFGIHAQSCCRQYPGKESCLELIGRTGDPVLARIWELSMWRV